jgi:hypothetical protein
MIIKVRRERVWGTVYTYPVCDTAKLLLKLIAGKGGKNAAKTFTPEHIETLKELGYELKIDAESI